ncbi:uncharacterized protein LOC107488698 [Arachis duranensis]|uniref:Uncharacterized protein LOC107488698 n=1 Tax=Arachis duranensis TaxID=130453 RepID=A0A6P4DER0_ARADU|nr:uncharacterized protein LOC107488698 [Arachis duranensis]
MDNALWTYKTASKILIGMSPYHIVYGKACHLPVELEHQAYWVTKFLNIDAKAVGEMRLLQLNELDEFRGEACENAKMYKEKTKMWHNKKISTRTFTLGQMVPLFNSRLKLFPGKPKTRWFGPFTITKVSPYGHIEVIEEDSQRKFIVNGQILKYYLGGDIDNQKFI